MVVSQVSAYYDPLARGFAARAVVAMVQFKAILATAMVAYAVLNFVRGCRFDPAHPAGAGGDGVGGGVRDPAVPDLHRDCF